MDFKSLKLMRSIDDSNQDSTLNSSNALRVGISQKHLKLVESELDNAHLIQYLDSITEEDEMIVTIDLRKKTLKRILQNLKEDNDKTYKLKEKNRKEIEKPNISSNRFYKENSKKCEPTQTSLAFTQVQKNELYLKFKSNIESKVTSIKFEIDQIINDVSLQAIHNTSQSNKKYKRYVRITF